MGANLTLVDRESFKHADIHPLASVHAGAIIGDGCQIGPYAVIGDDVVLGRNCVVHAHGVITGPTRMGDANEIFSFACIGGAPQDLRHRGEDTLLIVGSGNTFREHVTVGRGTIHGGGSTTIGNHNLVMAYCHIAHDCIVGDHVVMANGATLAGHVQVQDCAVFGGMVAVASFVRIGESAMLAAGSMIEKDVPPFSMVAGNRAELRGVNRVGISRRGFSTLAKREIKQMVRSLKSRALPMSALLAAYEGVAVETPEAARLLSFLRERTRGVTR